ncbi:MAG TPA: hypothetical protein VFK86_03265, partial [Bauldia sp.]|nr:hypothetical protein [Bauldia sp.]
VQALGGLTGVGRIDIDTRGIARIETAADVRPEIARRIVAAGGALRSMSISRTSLDQVYARYFEQMEEAKDAA